MTEAMRSRRSDSEGSKKRTRGGEPPVEERTAAGEEKPKKFEALLKAGYRPNVIRPGGQLADYLGISNPIPKDAGYDGWKSEMIGKDFNLFVDLFGLNGLNSHGGLQNFMRTLPTDRFTQEQATAMILEQAPGGGAIGYGQVADAFETGREEVQRRFLEGSQSKEPAGDKTPTWGWMAEAKEDWIKHAFWEAALATGRLTPDAAGRIGVERRTLEDRIANRAIKAMLDGNYATLNLWMATFWGAYTNLGERLKENGAELVLQNPILENGKLTLAAGIDPRFRLPNTTIDVQLGNTLALMASYAYTLPIDQQLLVVDLQVSGAYVYSPNLRLQGGNLAGADLKRYGVEYDVGRFSSVFPGATARLYGALPIRGEGRRGEGWAGFDWTKDADAIALQYDLTLLPPTSAIRPAVRAFSRSNERTAAQHADGITEDFKLSNMPVGVLDARYVGALAASASRMMGSINATLNLNAMKLQKLSFGGEVQSDNFAARGLATRFGVETGYEGPFGNWDKHLFVDVSATQEILGGLAAKINFAAMGPIRSLTIGATWHYEIGEKDPAPAP